MKQQYNTTDQILLVANNDIKVSNFDKAAIVFIDNKYTWFDLSLLSLDKKQVRRVFEKFYIFNTTTKDVVVYDAIHSAYDDIIEKARNLENNQILCDLLKRNYTQHIEVLVDFGCGTGFSSSYCNKDLCDTTIGVDISANMLSIANNFFDQVYTPEEFNSISINVDCALMSYVFHLIEFPEDELLNLVKKIKPGGLICGNFFKNTNIKSIVDFFERLNWESKEIKLKSNYNHGKVFIFTKPYTDLPFLNVESLLDSHDFFLESQAQKEIFNSLLKYNILPSFETIDDKYILQNDFDIYVKYNSKNDKCDLALFDFDNKLYLNQDTYAELPKKMTLSYNINAILKNILATALDRNEKNIVPILVGLNDQEVQLHITSESLYNKMIEEIKFLNLNSQLNHYEMTTIKTYMGTKKALSDFIVNIIHQFSDNQTKVIDLMSGTGIIASVASNHWETYASDLQHYSLVLAEAQGRGFSISAAELIEFLKPHITKNLDELKNRNIKYIEQEKKFINSKLPKLIVEEYKDFISTTPYYSPDQIYAHINKDINDRKIDHSIFPFCLFTAYFANHYLGILQSMEIDSIRYAIEQIEDNKIKIFALSALLGSLSQFVSSYGGHVAQPKYTVKTINEKNISKVLDERSKVIIFDFFTRIEEIEKHSEVKKFPIKIVPGPWQNAISDLSKILDENVIVYLDPPYSREEFGRYYHLYETLVKYNYPDAIGIGRTPDKKKGERYHTEFASRDNSNIEDTIVRIISKVLDNNWTCLWSYANNSIVRMIPVIKKVHNLYGQSINIFSYATDHRHSTQGKKSTISTIEYVIVFKKAN